MLKVVLVFVGDIRDPHGMKEAMKGCDAVLHLAALIAIYFTIRPILMLIPHQVRSMFCKRRGVYVVG